MREEFREKATQYLGGGTMAKKQTRFDKMDTKKNLNFELKTNPVLTQLNIINRIFNKHQKERAFENIKNE